MAQVMTDGFNVDPQLLVGQSKRVLKAVSDIQTTLGRLNTDMEHLFTDWTGRSSGGFNRTHHDWQEQYKKLHVQLSKIGEALQKTSEKYVAADTDNTPRQQA
jgi:WXG100 family type VII secretion target